MRGYFIFWVIHTPARIVIKYVIGFTFACIGKCNVKNSHDKELNKIKKVFLLKNM